MDAGVRTMSDTQINEEELRELIEQWKLGAENPYGEYEGGKADGLKRAIDDLEELIEEDD